jgi:Immunity protein 42
MIVGDPSHFAIESAITKAYTRLSFRALGFFVIHVGGRSYGVRSPDATMLACSFDQIQDRIAQRGKHTAPFAADSDAGEIADAFRSAIWSSDQENERFLGIPKRDFCTLIYSNHLMWAPDGDAAFDDSSYVLQFDIKDRVRLIAFRCSETNHHDPRTLSDVLLEADEFYEVLQCWKDTFDAEWKAADKFQD